MKRHVDRFTNLPNGLLDSVAVRSLSPTAFKVLVYLAKRCWGAKANGTIVFGLRSGCLIKNMVSHRYEENEIGIKKSAIGNALDELERRGLIACTHSSSFKLDKKVAREWRLTWIKTEADPPTNEYLRFEPPPPKPSRRQPWTRARNLSKNQKPCPPQWTETAPIVHPDGQPTRENGAEPQKQSTQMDCSESLSPSGRTRSYHRNRRSAAS